MISGTLFSYLSSSVCIILLHISTQTAEMFSLTILEATFPMETVRGTLLLKLWVPAGFACLRAWRENLFSVFLLASGDG